jgi:hypothetical protein
LQDVSNQDKNCLFAWSLSGDAVLDRVFYVLPRGITCWEKSKKGLFDTKHSTDCMLASEDEEHFQWAFHQFEKLLNDSPEVIFTDSDKALAAEWCNTIHLFYTRIFISNVINILWAKMRSSRCWQANGGGCTKN